MKTSRNTPKLRQSAFLLAVDICRRLMLIIDSGELSVVYGGEVRAVVNEYKTTTN
jgi:hypothetical protein